MFIICQKDGNMVDFELAEESISIDPRLVAGRIRSARLQKGWDILKLEKESGVSRGTLYRLEKAGTENPHFSTLCKVAEALQISPRSLTLIFDGGTEDSRQHEYKLASSSFDRRTNPVVEFVNAGNPGLYADWNEKDWSELFSTFGTGGALNEAGVIAASEAINRKRKIVEQLECVLETHLAVVAEEMIDALFQKVKVQSDHAQ